MPRSWSRRARGIVGSLVAVALGLTAAPVIAVALAPAAQAATACTPSATDPCLAGDGTAASPYQIATYTDLDDAAAAVAAADATSGTYLGNLADAATAHYLVTADIDYSQDAATNGVFAGFPLFGGVLDGAGHTISNITYGLTTNAYHTTSTTATTPTGAAAFVWYANDATVENLTLDHAQVTGSTVDLSSTTSDTNANPGVVDASGLVGWDYGSTVTGNTITNTGIVSNSGHNQSALLVDTLSNTSYSGSTTAKAATATISDNLIWNSKVTGNKYAAGVITQPLISSSGGSVVISDNLVDATVVESGNAAAGADGIAAMLLAQGASGAVGAPFHLTGNVVYGGGAYTDDSGTSWTSDTTAVLGNANGYDAMAAGVLWEEPAGSNLVSTSTTFENSTLTATGVTLVGGTTTCTSGCKTDGTAPATTDPSDGSGYPDLTDQATYAALGWDFDTTWVWDAAAKHPVLPSAPLITLARSTYAVAASASAPSTADLLSDFGAALDVPSDQAPALDVDTSAIGDWSVPGRYTLSVTGSASIGGATVDAAARQVTLVIAGLPGSGTAADPYRIGTKAQLDQAAALVDDDPADYAGSHYALSADIDDGGDTFATFDTFTGVFDGAGHTISNIVVASQTTGQYAGDTGFFGVLDGATVTHLHLDHLTATDTSMTEPVGGLAAWAYDATIRADTVSNATITLDAAAPLGTSRGQAGGLVGDARASAQDGTAGTLTISDNVVWNTTITASKYAAALVTYPQTSSSSAPGTISITDNLIDATIQLANDPGATSGGTAAFVEAQQGSDAVDTENITGNVVYGGSIGYGSPVTSANTFGVAPTLTPTTGTVEDNLVATSVTLGGTTTGDDGTPATTDPASDSTDPDLTAQATYGGLGWNFGRLWTWDAADLRPALPTAPLISLTSTSATLEVSASAPSEQSVLDAFGATIDQPSSTAALHADTSAVSWDTPGTYPVTLTADDGGTAGTPRTVSLTLVPVPTISTTTTSVHYYLDDTVTAADVIAQTGATLNVPGTITVDVSGVDTSTAGDTTVSLQATDGHGFAAAPVAVTITVAVPPTPIIHLAHSTLVYQATSTAPSAQSVLDALGVTFTAGSSEDQAAIDLSGVDFATPGSYSAQVTDSDTSAGTPPVPVTLVVVPAVQISATAPSYKLGDTVTAAGVLSDSGASLVDGGDNPVDGTIAADVSQVDTSQVGTYTVPLTVTEVEGHDVADIIGFSAAELDLSVTVGYANPPVITVAHPTITLLKGQPLPDDATLLADLGVTTDRGVLSTDAGTVVDVNTGGSYTVTITAYDALDPQAATQTSTTSVTVVIPALVGDGSAANPFQIGTKADLDAAAGLVNSDPADFAGAHYELTHDIDYGNGTFATFDTFTGDFDGAGHSVSNLTYAVVAPGPSNPDAPTATSKVPMGFFQTLTGATVENLTLDHVTANEPYLNAGVGGLVGYVDHATVTGDSVLDSAITLSGTISNGNNGQAAGLVAETGTSTGASSTGLSTISDNVLWNTTVTATKYPAGIYTHHVGGDVLISDNLIGATTLMTTAGGSGASGGFLVGQEGNASVTITGNVVYSGTATGLAPSTSMYAVSPAGSSASNNYVSDAVTITPGSGGSSTNGISGTKATVNPATDTVDPDLTDQSTYTLPPLSWNLSSAWAWDADAQHPVLPTAPLIRYGTAQAVLGASGTKPTVEQVWAAFGASVDASTATTQLGDDDSQVDWNTPGTYPITLTASDGSKTGTPRTLSLVLAPQPVLTAATPSLSYIEGDQITAADVIAASGATLSVPGTITVSGLDAITGPGEYTVHLNATDGNGLAAAPVDVTVDVAAPGGPAIVLQHTVTTYEVVGASDTPPAASDVLAALGASVVGGSGSVTLDQAGYAAIDWTTPGTYAVGLTDTADGVTRTATVLVTPVPTITVDQDTITVTQYGAAPTAAGIIAATNARLTDGEGTTVNGSLTVDADDLAAIDTSVGDPDPGYTVRLTGSDSYGHPAAEVDVHVEVRFLRPPVITLGRGSIVAIPYGDTAALAESYLLGPDGFDASVDHGTLSLSYTGTTPNEHTPGSYPAVITAHDDGYADTTVAVTVVVPPINGAGTADSPYLITDAADLDFAAQMVNQNPLAFADADFQLTNDINYHGNTFATFDSFSGVFDGAGHSILDMVYGVNTPVGQNKIPVGFFQTLTGATVENLSLNKVSVDDDYLNAGVGGVAGFADHATITDVSVLNSTIAMNGSSTVNGSSNGQVGGFVGDSNSATGGGVSGTTTISNDVLWNTTVSATKYAAGIITAAGGTVVISDNLMDARIHTDVAGGGTSALFESQGSDSGSVTISDNVVTGGDVGGKIVGYTVGGPAYGAYHYADNLVSSAVTFDGNTTTTTTTTSNADDGTPTAPAELAAEPAYDNLGWDFTGTWAWDATATRPVLANVPEVPVPLITVANPTVYYQAGAGPADSQALLDALGASIDGTGSSLGIDLTDVNSGQSVDFDTPGTYTVAVTGGNDLVTSFPVQVTVVVVPVITITTALDTIEYAVGADVSTAQFEHDTGVALSADGTLSADLSAVDWSTPGTYDAVFSATDAHGFTSPQKVVHVQVVDLPTGGVDPNPHVLPGTPTIGGTPTVGRPATADPGTWTPAGTPAYQWLLDGQPIAGATASSYTPVPGDAGHLLQVQVTESATGFAAATVVSDGAPVLAGHIAAGKPTMTGTAKVGQLLTAHEGGWSPTPDALAYQWLRGGVPIAGATSASYRLVGADARRNVSVTVYAVLAGYAPASATSESRSVAAGTFTAGKPTIAGTPKVGGRLTAKPGAWSPGARLTYQWLRNGSAIARATSAAYTPTSADRGKRISVRVTASALGYTSASATAGAVTVRPGTLAHPTKPRISGTAKVGRTLTVSAGSWSPKPTFSYQWYAAGRTIRGATRSSYTIAAAYAGTTITVRVTGTRAGYTTVTIRSAATKKVSK